jgi:hypothetical protein
MRKYGVKAHEKATVWANLKPPPGLSLEEALVRKARGPLNPFDQVPYDGRPQISFYDLATVFAHVDPNVRIGWSLIQDTGQIMNRSGNRSFVNGYIEMDSEVPFHFGTVLRPILESYLLNDPFAYSLTTLGNRRVANRWPLHHNCGDLFLDSYLVQDRGDESSRVSQKFVLQNGTRGWDKEIPIATRIQQLNALRPLFDVSANQLVGKLDKQLQDEADEEWLSYETGIVYGKSGQLRPAVMPGQYYLRLDSPFYYEPVNTLDLVNYKFTRDPHFLAEEYVPPQVSVGQGNRSEARVFMVPQYWRCRVSFKAWYIFFTWWAFTYVVIPFTFVFENRFPLFPSPWRLGTQEEDKPKVWNWIERSKAHGRQFGQIHALEFFTPFMAMIFVFTSDGFFEIRRTDTFPESLVAVVEVANRPYYCWRRTATQRDLTLVIGQGELATTLINPWGANLIGGIPENPGGVPV